MNIEKAFQKSFQKLSLQGVSRIPKKERSFELSLPAFVSGVNAAGRKFKEQTDILSISAQEISFQLHARLLIGAKLQISLEIPRTLILEKPLQLFLSGIVVFARSEDERGRKQFISARLDKAFKLLSDS